MSVYSFITFSKVSKLLQLNPKSIRSTNKTRETQQNVLHQQLLLELHRKWITWCLQTERRTCRTMHRERHLQRNSSGERVMEKLVVLERDSSPFLSLSSSNSCQLLLHVLSYSTIHSTFGKYTHMILKWVWREWQMVWQVDPIFLTRMSSQV